MKLNPLYKFEIGDKIVPQSKKCNPFPIENFEDYVNKDNSVAEHLRENGYLTVNDIVDKNHNMSYILGTNPNAEVIYICGIEGTLKADFFLEEELVLYEK